MVTDALPAGVAVAGAVPSVRGCSRDGPHRCPSTCSSAGLATTAASEATGLMISHQRQPSARSLPALCGGFPKEAGVSVFVYITEQIFMAGHVWPRHREKI